MRTVKHAGFKALLFAVFLAVVVGYSMAHLKQAPSWSTPAKPTHSPTASHRP